MGTYLRRVRALIRAGESHRKFLVLPGTTRSYPIRQTPLLYSCSLYALVAVYSSREYVGVVVLALRRKENDKRGAC